MVGVGGICVGSAVGGGGGGVGDVDGCDGLTVSTGW